MSYVIDRRSRVAAAVGLVGGVLLLAHTAAQARSPAEVPEPLLAQASGTPGPGAAPSPRPGAAPQVRQPAAPQPGSRDQDIQRQIDDLKKQMQITPNQEQQFNAFAEVMRSNAKAMDSTMQQQGQNPPKNAVDGLRAAKRWPEPQRAGLNRLAPASRSLSAPPPTQQKKPAASFF